MKSFKETFNERIDEIERRAKAAGATMTHLCRDRGIARATPDRWRAKAPKSIALVDELEAAVEVYEQRKAAEEASRQAEPETAAQ